MIRWHCCVAPALALIAVLACADPSQAADPVEDARRKITMLEIEQQGAEAQFELAMRFIEEYEEEQRLEKQRQASDPNYRPVGQATRLSGHLNNIGHKHDALLRIAQLIDAKVEAARVLPPEEQLRMIEADLAAAKERQRRAVSATSLFTVNTLIAAKGRVESQIRQRR